MTTKKEMLEIIKAENPNGLRVGNEQDGYTELSEAETEAILDSWADARLAKDSLAVQAQLKADAKASAQGKLTALGLTADDLKSLGL